MDWSLQYLTLSNHQQVVTSICVNASRNRLLSASADRLVKVYELGAYNVVHSLAFRRPVLSIGLSPDE